MSSLTESTVAASTALDVEAIRRDFPILSTTNDFGRPLVYLDNKLVVLGLQLIQIHDSILVECPEKNAEKVGKILKETMEGIHPLPVNLKVDISTGKNWGEL
jgi:DNA polymerase I